MLTATIEVMLISFTISFVVSFLNRLLISKFVGWREYRVMQKEIAEYQTQLSKALRANDKKLLEKLKKKEPQIMNMQKKLFKPQIILFGFSLFIYFFIWPAMMPMYSGEVAYVPGVGGISFIIWYMLCSIFSWTLISKILGITQVE
ncbi:MAG: EMC3/TMCO1 family protein [Candidatus Bathyarchaeia archaeon]